MPDIVILTTSVAESERFLDLAKFFQCESYSRMQIMDVRRSEGQQETSHSSDRSGRDSLIVGAAPLTKSLVKAVVSRQRHLRVLFFFFLSFSGAQKILGCSIVLLMVCT